MTKKPYTKFGSLASPGGASYLGVVQDSGDIRKDTAQFMVQTMVDMHREWLLNRGETVTKRIAAGIEDFWRKQWAEFLAETAEQGIPEKLRMLLQFTRKVNAVKYCKTLELNDDDLSLLIYNCAQIGFRHKIRTRDFLPQHLQLSRDDIAHMKKGRPKAFLKKTSGMGTERKRVMVHLFERDDQWHCFHFSWNDLACGDAAHWKYGAHIHYVSYLWSNLQNTRIMESFDKRTADIPGSMHIRFKSNAPPALDLNEDISLSGH